MNRKQILITFLPAIVLAIAVLLIRVSQYEPLYPKEDYSGQSSQTHVQIPLFPTDPIIGEKKAPKTVVAFEDFGCAPCAQSLASLFTFMNEHPGKVKIIWKGLPVVRVPNASDRAHLTSICADRQGKFESFARSMIEGENDVSDDGVNAVAEKINLNKKNLANCLATTGPGEQIETNKTIAQALGVQAVPTIFINNIQVESPRTPEGWKTLLGL